MPRYNGRIRSQRRFSKKGRRSSKGGVTKKQLDALEKRIDKRMSWYTQALIRSLRK